MPGRVWPALVVDGRFRRRAAVRFAAAMSMHGERVHDEGEAEDIEVLAGAPDAVGTASRMVSSR